MRSNFSSKIARLYSTPSLKESISRPIGTARGGIAIHTSLNSLQKWISQNCLKEPGCCGVSLKKFTWMISGWGWEKPGRPRGNPKEFLSIEKHRPAKFWLVVTGAPGTPKTLRSYLTWEAMTFIRTTPDQLEAALCRQPY